MRLHDIVLVKENGELAIVMQVTKNGGCSIRYLKSRKELYELAKKGISTKVAWFEAKELEVKGNYFDTLNAEIMEGY